MPPARGGSLLDVATGTGDIGYEALKGDPGLSVVGVDLTPEMMRRGRGKVAGASFPFAVAGALALPFRDGAFDAATSGFMMRNVVDIRQASRNKRAWSGRAGGSCAWKSRCRAARCSDRSSGSTSSASCPWPAD